MGIFMKKYSFTLNNKEIREFCIKAFLEQMRLQFVTWLIILAMCIFNMLTISWLGFLALAFLITFIVFAMCTNYRTIKKNMSGKAHNIWIEDGVFKIEADSIKGEVPCGSIQSVKKTKNLLMLGHYQGPKRLVWYIMPKRVFSDYKEMDEFINMLQNSQFMGGGQSVYMGGMNGNAMDSMSGDTAGTESDDSEILHLSLWIDEGRWKQILIEVVEITRSNIMADSQRVKMGIVLGVTLMVFMGCCLFGADKRIVDIVFFAAFMLLVFMCAANGSPAKSVKKQLKRGTAQNDAYGKWEISVSVNGVAWTEPRNGRVSLPWNKFLWLIESETVFYLFQEDKRHFLMLPKEAIGSYEHGEMLKQVCAENHITYAVKKDVKSMPQWVFPMLLVLLIIIYFMTIIWYAARDVRTNTQKVDEGVQETYEDSTLYHTPQSLIVKGGEQETQEFNPSDYPDYVPFDEQISVLSSYGFEISSGIAEQARSTMEEYDMMRIYIEGYPYTWLLMQVGSPEHDDEWNVTGYSDEVFWFDFEAWDISTDYITILEGMKALAPQSAINGVTNIVENTDNMDWEKGTGSIEVSLDWNGENYSWDMEVYYDWIDGKILGIFNSLLDKTDEESRFYVTGDNGQGAIVFYCSGEWAKDFEEATGLTLEIGSME